MHSGGFLGLRYCTCTFVNIFYHHISQLWNSQNSNRAKLSLSSGAAFKCRGSALRYIPFWPWPCGVTTTEASITRARWETAAGSSITAERRGRLNWQLSPPPLWRLWRLVWNYDAKSASLPGSSMTAPDRCSARTQGEFFLTLLLTSKQSYRLVLLSYCVNYVTSVFTNLWRNRLEAAVTTACAHRHWLMKFL